MKKTEGKKGEAKTGRSGKLTKEEERLLLENSRHVTKTASALFYGNGLIVSALPLCKNYQEQLVSVQWML